MIFYEVATLDTVIFGGGKAAPGIQSWLAAPDARGRLLGAFATDIGALNKVILLRAFDSMADMMAERERTLRADNPFNCAELLTGLSMESYKPLAFLPPVEPGQYGPVYEIRTYRLKVNGLAPTEEKWAAAIPPRSDYSRLAVALYGLDGAPRLTQFWPYPSLEARTRARTQSVADGKWPPKGGPDWLTTDMVSTIAMPMAFSPMT